MKFVLQEKNVYILSPNHWGDMHISKHHYAKELAKLGNKVYFISPPGLKNNLFEITEVEPNLFVINYYPIFRGKSILPKLLYNILTKIQIWYLQKKIGVKPDILWSFSSSFYYNLFWFKAPITIFHPMDQLNNVESVNIAKTANLVFTCSQHILDEMKLINTPKYIISHGLAPSFTHYSFPGHSSNTEINIGYVGNLFIQNLDRNTITSLIINNPSIHFHFFGAIDPNESNISAWIRKESIDFVDFLLKTPNVTCHGVVSSILLPEYIKNIDAFILCYKSTNENLITNSHKILEYLSTGKTVISSYVHEYKYSDLIEMCVTNSNSTFHDLFIKVVTNLNYYNSIENQNKRKAFTQLHSYASNIGKIEAIINQNNLNEVA